MATGDHIYVERTKFGFLYTHHGIDIGNKKVIHYDGEKIAETTLEKFCQNKKLSVQKYETCDSNALVVQRAIDRLGEQDYSLTYNNCEHFAHFCKTGLSKSNQVVSCLSAISLKFQILYSEVTTNLANVTKMLNTLENIQESKLTGAWQTLNQAFETEDSELVKGCIYPLNQLFEYYQKQIKDIKSSSVKQYNLAKSKEDFIAYTELCLIANIGLAVSHLFLGNENIATRIISRFNLSNMIFEISATDFFVDSFNPSSAKYIVHPCGIVFAHEKENDEEWSYPNLDFFSELEAIKNPTKLIETICSQRPSQKQSKEIISFELNNVVKSAIVNLFHRYQNRYGFHLCGNIEDFKNTEE